MQYYIMFMNPYALPTTLPDFDALGANVVITCAAGPPNTCKFDFSTGDKTNDYHCTTYNDWGSCTKDDTVGSGVNDVSTNIGDTEEQCIEKWNLDNDKIRCVSMKGNFSRAF